MLPRTPENTVWVPIKYVTVNGHVESEPDVPKEVHWERDVGDMKLSAKDIPENRYTKIYVDPKHLSLITTAIDIKDVTNKDRVHIELFELAQVDYFANEILVENFFISKPSLTKEDLIAILPYAVAAGLRQEKSDEIAARK